MTQELINVGVEGVVTLLLTLAFMVFRSIMKKNEILKDLEITKQQEEIVTMFAKKAVKHALGDKPNANLDNNKEAVETLAKNTLETMIDSSPNKMKHDQFDISRLVSMAIDEAKRVIVQGKPLP